MLVAAAAQGAIEYGIGKGRQEVEQGKITFGNGWDEARGAVAYVPGVNLVFDGARAVAGEKVMISEVVESALGTVSWFA